MTRSSLFGRLAPLAVLLALAGCGSDETPTERALERLTAGLRDDAPPAAPLTRERIDAARYALIAVNLPRFEASAVLAAAAENGGGVTYLSANRRSVSLLGAAVSSTHGLGHDLVGFRAEEGDPLVTPTPPQDWPDSYLRIHRYRDGELRIFSRAFKCAPEFVGLDTVVIAELTFTLAEMAERCGNRRWTYENRHWIDPTTGFVWKSRQWLGPEAGEIEIEVLRPFAR